MLVSPLQKILDGIRSWGYSERQFTLVSEGQWTSKDAEWNYLDVPHLNEVHSQANSEVLFYADASTSSILQQKVGPITFATLLTIYSKSQHDLYYSSTVGPFVLVVKSEWRDVGEIRARVETEYHVFAPKGLGWMLGIVQKVLTRNYRILMSEDLPLRERKGDLRTRGFSFRHDEIPHSFLESRKIGVNNVEISEELTGVYEYSLKLGDLRNQGKIFLGPNDVRGLRVERTADEILILPRMCMHEGACLDNVAVAKNGLRCPWHGRKETTLWRMSLEKPECDYQSPTLDLWCDGSKLLIVHRVVNADGN